MKKRTKTLILCLSIFIVAAASGFGLWYLLRDKAPAGNGNVLNVEWYHENGTEFTITTADELFEFAELSEYYDFKEQTIKLGADIVVNEGNAADWENTLPERSWKSIRKFAGTFDGQGHSISGLYGLGHLYALKGADKIFYTTGMFAETNAKCTIKNFKLLNSYFCSDLNEGVGSISSSGGGTFENIYSDAIVVSYKSNNGGIIGLFNQKGTISNCWFDGELRVEGNVGRFTGGIVGRVCATNGQSKIEHCLNTADISSTVVNRGMNTGGLIGNIQSQARINITDSLSVGDLTVDYTAGVGAFVGNIESSSAVIIKNAYVKAEAFEEVIYNANGSMTGAAVAHNEAMLTGYNAYKWSELDFKDYWAVVEDGTPILKSFADEVPSLKGVKKGYDISWYRPGEGEYLIKTPEQLYGLAILSYSNNFLGQAIYLGDNIVLNEGNAEDWATNAPENKWFSIGTYGFPFEGTFDGAGYTISGVYLNSCGGFGLFGDTSSSTAISNFKLENSYFEASGQTIGSIVGLGAGTIQNVYSNAIVVGNKGNVGGFAGQAKRYAGLQMNNCWFDGKAINLGNKSDTKKIGGLIGAVRSESAMNNCLNTGTIDASVFNYNQAKKKVNGEDVVDTENPIVVPIVGGLVGYVEKDVPFGIQDSLNVGKVLHHEDATAAYASVIGYIDGNVTAQNVYATTESCDNHPLKQSVSGQVCPMDTADLTGYKAYQWTLLDFEKNWAVNKKGTPILKAFAEEVPSLNGVKKEVDVSWYAADKKTFVLDSRQDLLGFRLMSYNTDFAEKTVKLGKNITVNTGDAAKWAESAPQYKWTPIGSQKYSFKGTFDGGMHSISGIYVKSDTEYSGFFAMLTEGTTVKNLKILNSYYESSADYLGSIAGSGNANLSNLYSNAILVSSANSAAGFVGRSTRDITITNCWFDGSATITGEGMPNRRAAGIVACAYSGNLTLSHCLNTGSVAAPNYVGTNSATSTAVVPLVGGLIGQVCRDAIVTIDDSLNAGDVTCNKAATTGYAAVVGYSDGDVTLTDTYATKESADYQLLGKSKGYIVAYEKADISGYLGYQWLTLDFDKHWAVVLNPTVSTPILKVFANEVPSLAGIEKVIDTSWYDADKTEYVLSDMADLNGFAYLSNSNDFAGKTVKLSADIVVNQDINNPIYKWDPIGTNNTGFAGTFDGQMHTISGLYTKTDVECAGLFASTTKDATVKNLILKDSYFESTAMNLGSIAGIGRGTFDTIKSEAIVVGHNARVGGFIGMNPTKGTKLTNCWFAGSVTNKGNGEGLRGTGGLVGVSYTDSDLTIENCLNTGDVDVSAYAYNQSKEAGKTNVTVLAGGLVGWFRKGGLMTMKDSLNVGRVIIGEAINNAYGSIVGYVDGDTKISNTYATEESSDRTRNGSKSGITVFPKAEISGVVSYLGNKLKLDFTKIWTLVDKETPVLRVFAKKTIDVTSVVDTTWYGDGKASTYTLYDRADLYGLAVLSQEHDFKGKTIKLGKDIQINAGNANDWSTSAPEMPWSPIASNDLPFQGTFDGQMYGISGVYYQTSSKFGGLFAAIGENATISNLKLTNSYFESTADTNSNFAALVGYGMGTIDTVYTDAIVVASGQNIAGFIGQMGNGAVLTECWFNGSVTNARSKDMRTGGLAGFVTSQTTKSVIKNCLNTGTIQASTVTGSDVGVGGFVGWVQSGGVQLEIKNSLSAGTVSANTATKEFGSLIGGIGSNNTVQLDTVYATSESCASVCGTTTVPTGTCIVYKTSEIAGEVGYQWERLDLDFDKKWTLVKESVPVLKAFADMSKTEVIDSSKVEKQVDTTWYDGVAGSTYTLYDKGDLYGFSALSQTNNFAGMTIKLGKDIEINKGNAADWATTAPEYSWTPIGEFAGTFDGDMHTISGIYVNTTTVNAGLFSKTIAGSKVQEFKLVNSYIRNEITTAASYIGSIAGSALGTFDSIYSDAIVETNKQRVGGLIGYVSSDSTGTTKFTMTNCWFDGTVTSTLNKDIRIGGLIGQSQATASITNCLNTGAVSVPQASNNDPEIAGLVGCVSASLSINNSLNVGTLNLGGGSDKYGAIVGWNGNNKVSGANNYYINSCDKAGQNIGTAIATSLSADKMNGEAAKDNMNLAFDSVWVTVSESTPILKTFAQQEQSSTFNRSLVQAFAVLKQPILWERSKEELFIQ